MDSEYMIADFEPLAEQTAVLRPAGRRWSTLPKDTVRLHVLDHHRPRVPAPKPGIGKAEAGRTLFQPGAGTIMPLPTAGGWTARCSSVVPPMWEDFWGALPGILSTAA